MLSPRKSKPDPSNPLHQSLTSFTKNPILSIKDFSVLMEDGKKCVLGKGSFGFVLKSKNEKDGKLYALKIAD